MKKHILFITESYGINPSPNGNCVEKIAQELIKQGDQVSILTLKNQFAKEKVSVINNATVYRVNTYLEWRVLFGKNNGGIFARILSRIIKTIKNSLIPLHPLRAPGVLINLYRKAGSIIKNNNVDIVVAVYRDFETAMCGALLPQQRLKVKKILYTLDAISGGVCSNRFVSELAHVRKCRRWEQYFLKKFDLYCAMQSHRTNYLEAPFNTSKIKYMDIPNLLSDNIECRYPETDVIRFVYTGMLSETNADCSHFLGLFQEMCNIRSVRFDIYGGISETLLKRIETTKLKGTRIFFHGRVSQEQLVEVRNEASVFLNFGNNHACGIPCKIFEYMSTGKMIISFSKIDADASTPYLQRYPNALVLREDSPNKNSINMILQFVDQHKGVLIDKAQVKELFYNNTPEAFIDLIHSV